MAILSWEYRLHSVRVGGDKLMRLFGYMRRTIISNWQATAERIKKI